MTTETNAGNAPAAWRMLAGVRISKAGFGRENCGRCEHLNSDQELLARMQWDTRLFTHGLVEITTMDLIMVTGTATSNTYIGIVKSDLPAA